MDVIQDLAFKLAVAVIAFLLTLAYNKASKALDTFMQKNLNADQRAEIDDFVRIAVRFAEQTGLNSAIKATAEQKKSAALASAHAALLAHGINIDLNELDTRIEAAVLDEFNRQRNDSRLLPSLLAAPAAPQDVSAAAPLGAR